MSVETQPLLAVRRCVPKQRIKAVSKYPRDDFLLVEIDPVIVGQSYGMGDRDIKELVLGARYVGSTLHPINRWPMWVAAFRSLNEDVKRRGIASETDLEMILIGELYRDYDAASESLRGFIQDVYRGHLPRHVIPR